MESIAVASIYIPKSTNSLKLNNSLPPKKLRRFPQKLQLSLSSFCFHNPSLHLSGKGLGIPISKFFLKTGTCKFGSVCKYNHPREKQAESSFVSLNTLGLPMRKDAKPCLYYMKNRMCKYTCSCKFHHPQPPRTANVAPVPVYGSAGVSSMGGTYFSSHVLQLQQNNIPVVLSPSQGWNTYMGSLRPLSVSSVLTAQGYNCHLSVPGLPERPDQPECRYFLNNGSCMYGADCRYHPPREKISQLAPSSIGPYGLPLRLVNKGDAALRAKPWPYYEIWLEVFGTYQATGNSSRSACTALKAGEKRRRLHQKFIPVKQYTQDNYHVNLEDIPIPTNDEHFQYRCYPHPEVVDESGSKKTRSFILPEKQRRRETASNKAMEDLLDKFMTDSYTKGLL